MVCASRAGNAPRKGQGYLRDMGIGTNLTPAKRVFFTTLLTLHTYNAVLWQTFDFGAGRPLEDRKWIGPTGGLKCLLCLRAAGVSAARIVRLAHGLPLGQRLQSPGRDPIVKLAASL